jgi:UDP-N-acetyl-2-amino-2-deoxyglucuronate dehydrogenase
MLGFALFGAGRIAQRHAELLGSGKIDNGKLVAICDVDVGRAKQLADKYQVPYYSSYQEMAAAEAFEVGVVLTPSGMHGGHAIEVAESGRHVVVEKPMALTLSDADEMIHACDAASVKLFVIKQNRFNVPVQKLREALEAGRFGKITVGTIRVRWCRRQDYYDQDEWRGTWAQDGGVLTNQASHHIDLLEWMLGDVESVYALTKTALVDIETEDTAVVCLQFASGALGVIEATTATRPVDLEGSISILGENGTVEIGGFAVNEMKTWKFADEDPGDKEVLEKYSVNPPDVYGFGHKSYYDHVVNCLSNDGPNLVGGLTGRKSLELITAIYESVETGQPVRMKFKPDRCRLGQ